MNALLDKDFLKKLDDYNSKEIYARITALTIDEYPLETIEGKVTGGTVNIDGASAIRRTCSLSLVGQDVNINEFYWGLNTKFKLEIGLRNFINEKYPDIIWFPQGIFVITNFNTNLSINNYTISISGKDKMCLLNGEIGGSLPASVDFGVEEYYNSNTNITTRTKIPIKKIIKEMIHTYAQEPYHNIIINDLDDKGLELMEYRGDVPLYMSYDMNKNLYTQMYVDGSTPCYILGQTEPITLSEIPQYNKRLDNLISIKDNDATKIKFDLNKDEEYIISKIEYGQTAGYRLTELVYAGDLISNIGESITSILDKIVTMLGNFEYFYNLEGKFIFQTKKTYIQTSYSPIFKTRSETIEKFYILQDEKGNWKQVSKQIYDDYQGQKEIKYETISESYIENSAYTDSNIYYFNGNNLIKSFANTPTLNNIKNDYSIWGVRKGIGGAEIPIHFRYAIHKKPTYYKNYDGNVFESDEYDWRELIYQMALDYYKHNQEDNFYFNIINNNTVENKMYYPKGITGYEQFYTDIQGFWRELYDINPQPQYNDFSYDVNLETQTFISTDTLYIDKHYEKIDNIYNDNSIDRNKVLVLLKYNNKYELHDLLDTIPVDYSQKKIYYITSKDETYKEINSTIASQIEKKEIFIKEAEEKYVNILYSDLNNVKTFYDNHEAIFLIDRTNPNEIEYILPQNSIAKNLFISGDKYNKYYTVSELDITGEVKEKGKQKKVYLKYYNESYEYFTRGENNSYWNKSYLDAPDKLNFWIEFLDSSNGDEDKSELDSYAITMIGDRPKVVNDKQVKSIYYRDVPNVIFTDLNVFDWSTYQEMSGYEFMFSPNSQFMNYFSISAQGKSAKNALDELLYNHSYCTESVNISAIPVYYLEPNTRISIQDEISKINGEYIISRITLPLTYNGTMSIQATKAPQRIY